MKTILAAMGLTLALTGAAMAAGMQEKTVMNGDHQVGYSVRGDGPLVVMIASTGRGSAEFAPQRSASRASQSR